MSNHFWGFCYECLAKHALAIEGHLDEGIAKTSEEGRSEEQGRLASQRKTIREYRKEWMRKLGETESLEGEHHSNPILTLETLRAEGRLIESRDGKELYEKDAMFYVVKEGEIIWSGRQIEIARSVFEERDPVTGESEEWIHEELKPAELCEPSSFRTVVRDQHRIVVCCPKGEWDESLPEGQQCRVGMISQKILHPIWEKGSDYCPVCMGE